MILGLYYADLTGISRALELPGAVAFLMWVVLVVILIKVSPILSVFIGFVVYLAVYAIKFECDDLWVTLALAGGVLVFLYFKFLRPVAKGRRPPVRDRKAPSRRGIKKISPMYDDPYEEMDEDDYEHRQRSGRRPSGSCCEYLKEFELGYYDNGMSQLCSLLGSQMTADEARRRCYYSENYERCPVRQKQTQGSWQGRHAGKGKSPASYCCRYLKEYPSGSYDYYSHRCEATETELPYDTARRTCYYSDDFMKCPIWQRYQ